MANCQTFDLLDLTQQIIDYGQAMREQGRMLDPKYTVEEHRDACDKASAMFDSILAKIRKELSS